MKVKYAGLQDTIFVTICINGVNYMRHFKRNTFYDLPDDIAKAILKNRFFISDVDLNFNNCDKELPILLQRKYALGDLIQLIPIVKYLKRTQGLKFSLVTSERFVETMKWFNIFENVYSRMPKADYEQFIMLDGVLENDHSLKNEHRNMHRVKIYESIFNISIDKYDFTEER